MHVGNVGIRRKERSRHGGKEEIEEGNRGTGGQVRKQFVPVVVTARVSSVSRVGMTLGAAMVWAAMMIAMRMETLRCIVEDS